MIETELRQGSGEQTEYLDSLNIFKELSVIEEMHSKEQNILNN